MLNFKKKTNQLNTVTREDSGRPMLSYNKCLSDNYWNQINEI